MPAPALEDYQFWFGELEDIEEGISFGLDTDLDVISAEGIESLDIRSGSRQMPRSDGAIPGLHLANEKMPLFEIETVDYEAYLTARRYLTISANKEGQLHWKLPDQPQTFMYARVLRRGDRQDGLTQEARPLPLAFEVSDPRIYGTEQHTAFINIYNPSGGGLDWEVDWEINFTDPGAGDDVIVHNAGNYFAYPVLKVFGPVVGTCTGVLLTNITTGDDVDINTTIITGQVLTANMFARVKGSGANIIELSGASKYGDWQLPRKTFSLHPGDNIVRFQIDGTSTDVFASLTWRDTSY